MALVYCTNCGKQVSSLAEKCPHCGAIVGGTVPQPLIHNNVESKGNNKKTWIVVGIIAVVVGLICILPNLFMTGEDYFLKANECKDPDKTLKYIKKAVEKGHPEAMFVYANSMFYEGASREKHLEAIELYRRSAEAGYPPSQMMYGINLINGSIIPKNVSEGYRWLERSAQNGFGEAQKTLGVAYYEGNVGVSCDMEKAKYWLSKAAEQNVDGAADMLAYIIGVERASYNLSRKMRNRAWNEFMSRW